MAFHHVKGIVLNWNLIWNSTAVWTLPKCIPNSWAPNQIIYGIHIWWASLEPWFFIQALLSNVTILNLDPIPEYGILSVCCFPPSPNPSVVSCSRLHEIIVIFGQCSPKSYPSYALKHIHMASVCGAVHSLVRSLQLAAQCMARLDCWCCLAVLDIHPRGGDELTRTGVGVDQCLGWRSAMRQTHHENCQVCSLHQRCWQKTQGRDRACIQHISTLSNVVDSVL